MAQTHYFPEDRVHYVWDDGLEPALSVAPVGTRSSTAPARSRTARSRPSPPPDALLHLRLGPRLPSSAAPSPYRAPSPATRSSSRWWTSTPSAGVDGGHPRLRLLPEDLPDAYLKVFTPERRLYVFQGRHRDPHRAVFRDDGRQPRGPLEAAHHAAGAVRREHGHAPRHEGEHPRACRCRCPARSSPAATPTRPRATARSALRASRARCTPRCASTS